MKHTFIKDVTTNDIKVCMECGYVWGERPYQKCPMELDGGKNGRQNNKSNCK